MSRSSTGIPGKLPIVRLSRYETSEEGTFGRLSYRDFSCFTGELPDRDNQPNVSCIPRGSYLCRYTQSPRFKKKMYEVFKVPGRAGIRIHSANFMGDDTKGFKKQLNGCIAFGLKTGKMDKQKALLLSGPAIRKFEETLDYKPFILEIK